MQNIMLYYFYIVLLQPYGCLHLWFLCLCSSEFWEKHFLFVALNRYVNHKVSVFGNLHFLGGFSTDDCHYYVVTFPTKINKNLSTPVLCFSLINCKYFRMHRFETIKHLYMLIFSIIINFISDRSAFHWF